MTSQTFNDGEVRLVRERRLKFKGTARIDLEDICYPQYTRELDSKNVERLCGLFRETGCHRFDVQNHITAVVGHQALKRACRSAKMKVKELLHVPPEESSILRFSTGEVSCLHGRHRLKAAEEILPPNERWWTVDLYLDDISLDLKNALVDEYANEKKASDGEIYRKLRQYQNEYNAPFQKRWWARLSSDSENKAKRLRQLFSPDNIDICAAFDALLPISGMWGGMSIGSLNRVLALKCDEEIVNYLHHINTFWSTLVDGDRQKLSKIDLHTVEILQLKAPSASEADARKVQGLIVTGEAFQQFDEDERATIWTKLSNSESCKSIIPSLFTFFRDVTYLKECADGIKQLVTLSKGQSTVRAAMKKIYLPSQSAGIVKVQTSENSFRNHPCLDSENFELAYRQLWLFAMRHYPQLARKTTSKRAVAKANCGKADGTILYNLAALSQKLGFKSAAAIDLIKVSPDRQIAREALLKARRPESYEYDTNRFESLIERVVECFAFAVEHEISGPHTADARVTSLNARCGPPREATHDLDRSKLFLNNIHSEITSKSGSVSSFYVRQCVYFAFFGRRSISSPNRDQSREMSPSSPLFVPVHSPRMDLDEVDKDASQSKAHKKFRREERRKRREKKRKSRQRKNNLEFCRRSVEPATSATVICTGNTNEDIAMEEPAHLPVVSFTPTLVEPEVDHDMDEGNFIDRDTEAEISRCDGAPGRLEEEFAPQIPCSRSVSPAMVSDYETLIHDEPQKMTINENRRTAPSRPNSLEECPDRPIQFTDSGQVAATGETPPLSDTHYEGRFHECQVVGDREAGTISSPCGSAASTANLDEIQAAENDIQETLRTLEEESQSRAQDAQFISSASVSTHIEEPTRNNAVEPTNPALVDPQVTEQTISTQLQDQILTTDELIQQGQEARRIRAAKRANRFNDREEKATAYDQLRQDDSQMIHQAEQHNPSGGEESLEPERKTRRKRREKTDQSDDMIVALVDEVIDIDVSPPPRMLQPQQIPGNSATTITFRCYVEQKPPGDTAWRITDEKVVDAGNLTASSEVQRLVEKYARKNNKNARFYNRFLKKVTAARCVEAAIEDGSYTVFMSLGKNLEVTKEKLDEVAEVLKDDSDEEL